MQAEVIVIPEAENRPHGDGARVSHIVVMRVDQWTIASTGDWALSVAMELENLRLLRVVE